MKGKLNTDIVIREDVITSNEFNETYSIKTRKDLKLKTEGFYQPYGDESLCFLNYTFKERVFFDTCCFKESVDFEGSVFEKGISFKNCIFEKDVNFKGVKFEGKTSFKRTEFKNKVRFHKAKFQSEVDFENTIFEDLADFWSAEFKTQQKFHLTDFLSITIFSNVTFEKGVQFLYNKINPTTTISFQSAIFKQSLDISRANFLCKLHFWNAEITSIIPEDLKFYKDYESEEEETALLTKIRESYRIIKNEFAKEGNTINYLLYHSYEMTVYEKELSMDWKNRKWDWIQLNADKWSNNFGMSWWRGVVFTFSATLIVYIIFLTPFFYNLSFDCSFKSIGNTLKHFIELLNITKWDIEPFGIKENVNWRYIVLFLGRIFIAFGYYQTVQAFRKFGKK